MRYLIVVLPVCLIGFILLTPSPASAAPAISQVSDNRSVYTNSQIPQFEKFEISLQVAGISASNLQFPFYLSTGPSDYLNKYSEVGINVDGVFTSPNGKIYRQPGFYYQEFLDEVRNNKPWYYPTNNFSWKVRFAPNMTGTWQYQVEVKDKGGTIASAIQTFNVVNANPDNHGFLRVSSKDSRYFEFEDGTYFQGLSINEAFNKASDENYLQTLSTNGIKLLRMWMQPLNIYSSAWDAWYMMPGHYDNYLPRVPILPLQDVVGQPMKFMWYLSQDSTWYEQCAFMGQNQALPSIKSNANYHLKVKYKGVAITGPRDARFSNYGLVMKIGGWQDNCEDPYEPGVDPSYYATVPVTTYGRDSNWNYIEGDWNSGTNSVLPKLYMALENASSGSKVYIESVEMRENGTGPNIIEKHSPDELSYMNQMTSYKVDKMMNNLKKHNLYIKPVVLELNEYEMKKLDKYGNPLMSDDVNSFYGAVNGCTNCRELIASRWLQEAWWRYLQARWGYSTQIHSWELINEGDPWHTGHYALADEMGKFFKCRAFGIVVPYTDGAKCDSNHPNAHMTYTSFWHSFPAVQFWNNTKYPNIDYADVHAYVSTGYAPLTEKTKMQYDSAYFHTWYSADLGGWNLGKPVIRGETGMDCPSSQNENCLDLYRDTEGVWLHKFLWAQLHPGGLLESYWWVGAHIYNPSTSLNHLPKFKTLSDFFTNIPLNNGQYQNISATSSNPNITAIGQKDIANNRAHLWVQNLHHRWALNYIINSSVIASFGISQLNVNKSNTFTFTNPESNTITVNSVTFANNDSGDFTLTGHNCSTVAQGSTCNLNLAYLPQAKSSVAQLMINYTVGTSAKTATKQVVGRTTDISESATVTISGFSPNTSIPIQYWNFTDASYDAQITSASLSTSSSGDLVININNLSTDIAIKIGDYNSSPPPTVPPPLVGDFDGDGDVDFLDFQALIGAFNTIPSFNLIGDPIINLFDFNHFLSLW